MAITTVDVTIRAQWDALVAELQAEMGAGNRLSGIQYVGRAYTLWTKESPAIGVQLRGATIQPRSSMQRTLTSNFNVVVGVQSTDATAATNMGANTPANGEDAMNQLQTLIGDGSGNGLLAVLADRANFTLAGTAYEAYVGDVGLDWEISPGANPQIWAYAVVVVTASAVISIFSGS